MKYLLFLFVAITSLSSAQENSVKQFLWLEGNWKLDGKEEYEKWQLVNDSTIGGISYHYAQEEHDKDETDIYFDESIRLIVRGANYFYIPKPHGESNGKEVEFKITSFSQKALRAENLAHDFPQRIAYELKNADHLHAYIEGKTKGKKRRTDFNFTKAK